MATKTRRPGAVRQPPEVKIGPFQGGLGVAIWRNEIQTEAGPKMIRSISIAPRRYRDKQTGEWKDATSYRPGDLSALILALEKAREYCLSTPLPGEQSEDDRMQGMEVDDELA
ncbi:MAG: hypothetical protein U0793_11160 [Gemmataceae bacterium]